MSLLWRPLSVIEPVVCGRVRVPWEEGTVRENVILALREESEGIISVRMPVRLQRKSNTYLEVESACRAMKN